MYPSNFGAYKYPLKKCLININQINLNGNKLEI